MPSKGEKKAVYMAEWFQKNRPRLCGYYADYRHGVREEMVAAYGGECVECGIDDPIVLVLDHINDGGGVERKTLAGGFKLYMRLRKAGWPTGTYQLLCHNCNFRKEYRRRKDAVKIKSPAQLDGLGLS